MVDTRALCLTVLAAALLISGAIIYGASMVKDELHGMIFPAVGDLDGDGKANDVVLCAYGQPGFIIGNETMLAKSGFYDWSWKNSSHTDIDDIMGLVGVS